MSLTMSAKATLASALDRFPRERLTHVPTLVETLDNLSRDLGLKLSVKRDDCTGFAFGGNKVRQLEFYLGQACDQQADTVLITGAVQSNFVRTAAAMSAKLGMACHVQLEDRVSTTSEHYRTGGNVLLNHLLGTTVHHYKAGEDESGADAALDELAGVLQDKGANPYVIHLGMDHPPIGALGYVAAAMELADQLQSMDAVDVIYIASGSALTHIGVLYGLRKLGLDIPVRGVCVRRSKSLQQCRVATRLQELANMLIGPVSPTEIQITDVALAPGYGVMSEFTQKVIEKTARREGLFIDPVYSGKTMSAVFNEADQWQGKHVLMWHTGGQPALFAYQDAFGY